MTVKCNLGTAFVKRGTGEEEKVTEGGRRGRVWVTLLCASFYCPFIWLIKVLQRKLKVSRDIYKPVYRMLTEFINLREISLLL